MATLTPALLALTSLTSAILGGLFSLGTYFSLRSLRSEMRMWKDGWSDGWAAAMVAYTHERASEKASSGGSPRGSPRESIGSTEGEGGIGKHGVKRKWLHVGDCWGGRYDIPVFEEGSIGSGSSSGDHDIKRNYVDVGNWESLRHRPVRTESSSMVNYPNGVRYFTINSQSDPVSLSPITPSPTIAPARDWDDGETVKGSGLGVKRKGEDGEGVGLGIWTDGGNGRREFMLEGGETGVTYKKFPGWGNYMEGPGVEARKEELKEEKGEVEIPEKAEEESVKVERLDDLK